MLRAALTIGLIVAALGAATAARAQHPTQSEMYEALQFKIGQTQGNLDQTYLALAQAKRLVDEGDASLKWVLDNWIPKPAAPPKK